MSGAASWLNEQQGRIKCIGNRVNEMLEYMQQTVQSKGIIKLRIEIKMEGVL